MDVSPQDSPAASARSATASPPSAPASVSASSWAAYIQATARQPESAGLTRTYVFLGFALTEALALIGFVVPFVFGT